MSAPKTDALPLGDIPIALRIVHYKTSQLKRVLTYYLFFVTLDLVGAFTFDAWSNAKPERISYKKYALIARPIAPKMILPMNPNTEKVAMASTTIEAALIIHAIKSRSHPRRRWAFSGWIDQASISVLAITNSNDINAPTIHPVL